MANDFKYLLIDIQDNMLTQKTYSTALDAVNVLENSFFCYTSEEHGLAYGNECEISEDSHSAWAKADEKYRIWYIIKVK